MIFVRFELIMVPVPATSRHCRRGGTKLDGAGMKRFRTGYPYDKPAPVPMLVVPSCASSGGRGLSHSGSPVPWCQRPQPAGSAQCPGHPAAYCGDPGGPRLPPTTPFRHPDERTFQEPVAGVLGAGSGGCLLGPFRLASWGGVDDAPQKVHSREGKERAK